MRFELLLLVAAASASNVIEFNLKRSPVAVDENAPLERRETVGSDLSNAVFAYYTEVEIGTPAQNITLSVSTGSSDVWLLDVGSPECSAGNGSDCLTPFSPTNSSTLTIVKPGGFSITYQDDSYVSGDFVQDVFVIGSANISLQMGIASNTSSGFGPYGGVMGIGYTINEAGLTTYPNIMDDMVASRAIGTKLYSIWLNTVESNFGSILFGGIDTAKFKGNLYTLPVELDNSGVYSQLQVLLTGVSFTGNNGTTNITDRSFAMPAVLETSTTLIYLPDEVVDSIFSLMGAVVVAQVPYVDCTKTGLGLSFTMGYQAVIEVPYSELIRPAGNSAPTSFDFNEVCRLQIRSSGTGNVYLGDYFLRSAYVVYDLTNNQIGIAQSNFNSTSSSIVEISAGATTIPSATILSYTAPTSTITSTTRSTSSRVRTAIVTSTGSTSVSIPSRTTTSTVGAASTTTTPTTTSSTAHAAPMATGFVQSALGAMVVAIGFLV